MILSVILTTYNSYKNHLGRSLSPLLVNLSADIELIIIDDGSSDENFAHISKLLKEKDANDLAFVIRKSNCGLSSARNEGIKSARGEYLCFLDDDDSVRITSTITFLKSLNSQYDIIDLAVEYPSVNNKVNDYLKVENYETKNNEGVREYFKSLLVKKSYFAPAQYRVYNRKFLLENDLFFYEGIVHEDEEWTPRVFLCAQSLLASPLIHYVHYLDNLDSISRSKNTEKSFFRASSLVTICKELEKLSFSDFETDSLFRNYVANIYMQIPLHNPYLKLDRLLPIKYAKDLDTRLKSFLFVFGNRIYLSFRKILK